MGVLVALTVNCFLNWGWGFAGSWVASVQGPVESHPLYVSAGDYHGPGDEGGGLEGRPLCRGGEPPGLLPSKGNREEPGLKKGPTGFWEQRYPGVLCQSEPSLDPSHSAHGGPAGRKC